MKPPTQVDGHRIGDRVAIAPREWARTRDHSKLFRIVAFEVVNGEPWARMVPTNGGGFYRCPVSEIGP